MSVTIFARFALALLLYFCIGLIFFSLGSISLWSTYVIQFLLSLCFLLWFAVHAARRSLGRTNFIFPFIAIFMLWLAIQALGQRLGWPGFFPHVASWDERIRTWMMFVSAVVLYLAAKDVMPNRKIGLAFIQVVVIFTCLIAVYLSLAALISPSPEYFWRWNPITFLQKFWPWLGSEIYPNYFVKMLFPGAFFSLSCVFYAFSLRGEVTHKLNLYGWLLMNVCFASIITGAIFLTRSRAGIMAFCAAAAVYCVLFVFSHRRPQRALKGFVFVLAAIIFFLLTLGLKDVLREVQTFFPSLVDETQLKGMRGLVAGAGWQIAKAQGLWGVGLGNYQMGWVLLHKPPFYELPGNTFNDFVWLWAETGLPGILCIAGGLLFFFIRAIRKLITTESYFIGYFLLAAVASAAALCLHAFIDPVFYVAPILWLTFLVLGMGGACFQLTRRQEQWLKFTVLVDSSAIHWTRSAWGAFKCVLLIMILFFSAATGWISIQKARAYLVIKKGGDEKIIQQALRLDPLNPVYREQMASFYQELYQKNPRSRFFDEAIHHLNKALELDAMAHSVDTRKAAMYLAIDDLEGVRAAFDAMRKRLPNYYLGELAASIFYMESSLRARNRRLESYLEEAAVEHYKQVLALHPQFQEMYRAFRLGTPRADAKFQKLKEEGRI